MSDPGGQTGGITFPLHPHPTNPHSAQRLETVTAER